MGGRITRALYKNERQTSMRGANRFGTQMRELSVSFTLVMSSIASFLIGYLHRPYSLQSIANLNTFQQSHQTGQQQPQALTKSQLQTDWQMFMLSFLTFIIVTFIFLLRRKHSNESSLQHILGLNKIMLTVSGLLFIVDIISWAVSYEVNWVFTTAYGLLWMCFANICLLVFNNMKFVQHRKECKQSQEEGNDQNACTDRISSKRSIFLILLVILFEGGSKCSEYMRELRVDKMVKEVIEGKLLLNPQHQGLATDFSGLPAEYQTYIMEAQFYEKLMLRVMFLFLVLMIGTTVMAFEKKSLFHFYLFQLKRQDYQLWYQREILDKKSDQIGQRNQVTGFKNLSGNSILMSTFLFIIGTVLIESQARKISFTTNEQAGYQNEASFKSGCLFTAITLGTSILLLKGFMWAKALFGPSPSLVKENQRNERKTKAIEIGALSVIFMVILFASALVGYVLELNSQVPTASKQLSREHSEMGEYFFPLSILQVAKILLVFSYIRFTKEQLWRFPQTAFQPYLTFAVVFTFISQHVIPDQLVQFVSDTLINCIILPLVRVLKSAVYIFVAQGPVSSLDTQRLICTFILVFGIVILLVGINSHQTISNIVNATGKKINQNTHQFEESKKPYSQQYSDEDSKPKLTSNLIFEQSLDQAEEGSKLLK